MTLHNSLFQSLETLQEVFYMFFYEGMEFSITTVKPGQYWIQIEESEEFSKNFFAAEIDKNGNVLQIMYEEESKGLALQSMRFLESILGKKVVVENSDETTEEVDKNLSWRRSYEKDNLEFSKIFIKFNGFYSLFSRTNLFIK